MLLWKTKMPKQKKTMLEANSATIEELPNELWEKIGNYLDTNTKYQLQCVSNRIKDRITGNCLTTIRFENPKQYQKFIDIKSIAQHRVRNLHLSADVTDFIFPFPKHYKPSEFSFFSTLKKRFPAIKTITLELKHFYMLPMLIDDPQFRCEDNYRCIKKLTLKPLALPGLVANKLIEIKYGENISRKKTTINFFNSNLTPETLTVFEKFTALRYLKLHLNSLSDIKRYCDYEDIHHLLLALPQLKTFNLTLNYDLAYDPEKHRLDPKSKGYVVNVDTLQHYPNITHLILILNGWPYWPESLLSHFPAIKKLALNFTFSKIFYYRNNVSVTSSNRITQLLAELLHPEKLLSLEIPASVPLLTEVKTPSGNPQAFKLIPINLTQLTRFTHLQELTLHQANDLCFSITENNHSPFFKTTVSYQGSSYALATIQRLEIHYGQYHTYHPGDLKAIRAIFPHLKFLNLIKEAVDENKLAVGRAKEIKEKSWPGMLSELNTLLNESPWQDIQISISGIDPSEQQKLSSHHAECIDNKLIIRKNFYLESTNRSFFQRNDSHSESRKTSQQKVQLTP
jgi:hypothetical protein